MEKEKPRKNPGEGGRKMFFRVAEKKGGIPSDTKGEKGKAPSLQKGWGWSGGPAAVHLRDERKKDGHREEEKKKEQGEKSKKKAIAMSLAPAGS